MIEVPMLETLASFWLTEHLFGETWNPGRGSMGYDRIINKYRHPFPTNDGYICALPYTDAHWVRFFEIVERPDLAKDPRFCDRTVRPKHFSELYQVLDSLMKHRSTQEWLDAFDEADIPAMPVNTLEGPVRRSAPEGDRLLHRARASDRGADHDLRQPARFREDQGRVPPPRAAPRRGRRRGLARGRPERGGDRQAQGRQGADRSGVTIGRLAGRGLDVGAAPRVVGERLFHPHFQRDRLSIGAAHHTRVGVASFPLKVQSTPATDSVAVNRDGES